MEAVKNAPKDDKYAGNNALICLKEIQSKETSLKQLLCYIRFSDVTQDNSQALEILQKAKAYFYMLNVEEKYKALVAIGKTKLHQNRQINIWFSFLELLDQTSSEYYKACISINMGVYSSDDIQKKQALEKAYSFAEEIQNAALKAVVFAKICRLESDLAKIEENLKKARELTEKYPSKYPNSLGLGRNIQD